MADKNNELELANGSNRREFTMLLHQITENMTRPDNYYGTSL